MASSSLLPGIKNLMQKEIFDDEKLKSIISVTKLTGRSKKKPSYLTLSGKFVKVGVGPVPPPPPPPPPPPSPFHQIRVEGWIL